MVRQSLRLLNDSAFFDRRLHDFTEHLIGAIDHVLAAPTLYDSAIVRQFADQMRLVQSYLAGSTSNEIPYEVVYCLTNALAPWVKRETIIVTSLTEGHNFHLLPVDPWNFIRTTISGYDTAGFNILLVMIGVPRLYSHKPVFCIPLFHELGHFVDVTSKLSEVTVLLNSAAIAPVDADELAHRREFFADVFSSCFVGYAGIEALKTIAPNHPTTYTHPATADRIQVVSDFLGSINNPIVDLLTTAVAALGLPNLRIASSKANLAVDFDDLRTFAGSNIGEVYGIFEAAWNYMFEAIDQGRNPWGLSPVRETDIETVVNDLTEKSIRNYALRVAWNETATP
ncbi:hypothetical protein NKH80_22500 [Mesorhizobium sp. M0904]|uniref:hypothetical protein n=1 Tax=Mesorhizobium sp. M0904 TaxID=2957022 RepID=UPI00333A9EA1